VRRAAVLVVLALLSLVPPTHATADTVRVVGITRLGSRRPPKTATPDGSGPRQQVAPHPDEPSTTDTSAPNSPAQTTVINTSTASVGVNVKGFGSARVLPPDPAGEVGATQFVHTANSAFGAQVGVYDKTTGALDSSFHMSDLAASGPCRHGLGDGVPFYDQLDSRWFLTEIATRLNSLCVYVSDSPDAATANYTAYRIEFNVFPDYPKWAVWPDAIYLGFNTSGFNNPMVAFNKAKLIAGAALTSTDAVAQSVGPLRGFAFQLLVPVDLDGMTQPTGPGIFVRHVDDELNRPPGSRDPTHDFIEYYEFTPDFIAGTASVGGPFDVAVSEFDSKLCPHAASHCIPQRGTTMRLDSLRQPMMNRPVLRVIGANQTMVGSFTVDAGHNRAGIRWFELTRPAATTTQGWTLADEGTYAPSDGKRWVPSVDIDAAGDIGLGFSTSSKATFPSIRITGRLAGDPAGTMTAGETTIQKSTGPQTDFSRWGDYTEMSVDPVDDSTFWYTNEYLNRQGIWRTRIASFTLGP
jgi:hypothetical protein